MSDFTAQRDATGSERAPTAPAEAAHVTGNLAAPRGAWYSRPTQLIVICGIILVIVVIAATSSLLSNLRDRDLAEKEQTLESLALVLAEQIDRGFQSIELVQTAVIERIQNLGVASAEDYERQMSGYDTYRRLKDAINGLPYINAIVLTDARGKLVNFSRSWPIPSVKSPDQDPSEVFGSDPRLVSFVGKPLRSPVTGNWVVSIARKLTGPNGEFLGVVQGAMELQYFEQMFQAIVSGPNSTIALFRRDGTLLVRYPRQEAAIGQSFPQSGFLKTLATSDHGTYRQTAGVIDGQERLISARRLAHYPVALVVTTTVADALANWKRGAFAMVVAALIIGLVIGGVVVLCVWVVGKKLREQSLQRDMALNNMSQGLAMFDSAGRLVVCNDRYRQMYDFPPDLVKPGCTVLDLLKYRFANGTFSSDPEEYTRDLPAMIAQGKKAKHVVETGDGRIIAVTNQPMASGGWVATHEDVTEKVRAEKLSEQQKLQLDAALENMSHGLCMFDAEQRLIVCNKRYADIYGLNEEQIKPGTRLRAILEHRIAAGNAPKNHEKYFADRLHEVALNQPYQVTNRLDDGRYISVVHTPMAEGGWVATHEDVTEIKLREESFRLLFKGSPVPMWVFDLESFRFLAVNDAAVAHYGYSHEQFLAMTVLDVRAAEERAKFVQFIQTMADVQVDANVGQHQKSNGAKIEVSVCSRNLMYAGHKARLVAVHDITKIKLAESELHRTQKFLDTIIEHVPAPILVKDILHSAEDASQWRYTLINRACEELLGVSRTQIIGKTIGEIYPKERADFIIAENNETSQSHRPVVVNDHIVHTPGNGIRLATAKSIAVRDDDGKVQYLLTVLDDVTERRRAEQRIVHMAHYDNLTDLPNRAAFNECFASTLDKAAANHEQFAVLSLDLDRFKEVNDVFGHSVGDALLREVTRRLQAAAAGAFLARIGGDEFMLIAADGAQPAAGMALAERLLAAFTDELEIDGRRLEIGLSIGGAVYPTHGADAKTLMVNADAALYRAKAEARGSVLFFEAEMSARLGERLSLQGDLRSAVAHHELFLHYQPQVRMTGETIGFEALVRWQCPKRGMVSPATFIPLAEESGLIIPIGEWVLREACREAASWPQPVTIAVNVSPIQFHHGDLPSLVHTVLLETGLSPARLELEITEGVLINDFSRAVSILRRLKSLGVQIALDDFGTGYSSLSYLHSFAFDRIKIDRAFIGDLEHNRHSMAIVRAVIGLGHSLDVPILAEGVETEIQHAFLVQEGCDSMQGYLTGRPQPISDYAKLVGRQVIARQNYAVAG